jgi:hypothetical protein
VFFQEPNNVLHTNTDRVILIFALSDNCNWTIIIPMSSLPSQRNYRFFFMFIATSTFLCMSVLIFSWLNVYGEREDNGGSIWRALRKEVYSFVLIIYTSIVVWFVGGLTVLHLYLISTNQVKFASFCCNVKFLLQFLALKTQVMHLSTLKNTRSSLLN